jgi:hypothetical protein
LQASETSFSKPLHRLKSRLQWSGRLAVVDSEDPEDREDRFSFFHCYDMVGILRILLLCAVAGLAHAKILSTNNNTSPFLINSAVPLVDASSGGTNICTAKNALVTAEFTTNIKAIFYNRMICPFGIPVIAHQDVPDANIIFTANIVARYLDKNQ